MPNKHISFIMPCYNCADIVADSIKSILNLGLDKYEICLVDDGSTDMTYKVLQQFKDKFPEIIKIGKNDRNMGGSITRNNCVNLSQYEYIFCLDSDNILDKESFLRLYDAIDDKTNLLAFSKIFFFYSLLGIRYKVKEWEFLPKSMNYSHIRSTLNHPVASGNYLFTRNVYNNVKGYETDLGALDAFSLGYKALIQGYEIDLVPNSGYFHRLHPGSYWLRESKKNNENLRKLLLRYPTNLSDGDLEMIKTSEEIFSVLVNTKDEFSAVKTDPMFSLVYKVKTLFK